MKTETKKITGAKTRLERHVQKWINERAEDYDSGPIGVLKDLNYGGCSSGMVGHLIYYTDTVKFFQTHRRERPAVVCVMLVAQNRKASASPT